MSELILKVGGAICVIAASFIWGEYKARSLSLRAQQLQKFQQALQLLAAEISYTVTPLPHAFANVGQRMDGLVGEIFDRAGFLMQSRGDVNAREAWLGAIEEFLPQIFITNEDRQILEQLGNSLGVSDGDNQLKQIKLVDKLLEGALREALDERNRSERMWRYLGVLGGLMLVIIFI